MTKKKAISLNLCRYCRCDISHLHHNAVHCKKSACFKKFKHDRIIKIKKGAERWRERNKKHVEKKHIKKGDKRQCQECKNILPKGRWYFCNDFCQALMTKKQRIDGDWRCG